MTTIFLVEKNLTIVESVTTAKLLQNPLITALVRKKTETYNKMQSILVISIFIWAFNHTWAFTTFHAGKQHQTTAAFVPSPVSPPSPSSLSMCICIDCARVTNCAAYHFVETKHEQPHMTDNPTFTPQEGSPTIHVNVRNHRNENEMARIWKEHEQETKLAQERQNDEQNLHGEKVYDPFPTTTVEYDVVKCADFVLEKGCWVKNMPQEIKDANPDFVPT